MTQTKSLAIAGAAAICTLSVASMAFAQAKPKAAAAPAAKSTASEVGPTLTANVPGVCVLSREGIVQASTVGKYVQTRLGQLQTQAKAEITGDETTLQNEAKELEAKKATLGDAAYQQQRASLQQRIEAWQQKAQLRDRELQATEQKAAQRVLQEATPLIVDEVKAKNCAVVLDADAVMAVNPSMNLTQAVITALNGKLTQFDFDREHLDAQAAAQQR